MPLYEQKCGDCKHKLSEFRSIAEGPRQECPKCGSKLFRQVWDKAPVMHVGGYSPMHPRALRGRKRQ